MTSHNAAPVRVPASDTAQLTDTQPMTPVHPQGGPKPGMRLRRRRRRGWLAWLLRLPLLVATGLLLLIMLVVMFIAAHQMQYASRIYPGVSAYGIDLSGMTFDEAAQVLEAHFEYDERAVFTFRDGDDFWQMTAGQLGVSLDVQQTVSTAMLQGRADNLIVNLVEQGKMWLQGRVVQPVIVYDQTLTETFLEEIARTIDRPMRDASLELLGTHILANAGQVGRAVDVPATLALLREEILTMESGAEIPLVINEMMPAIQSVEEPAAALASALSAPLSLYAEDGSGGPWDATPEAISLMLEVARVDHPDGSVGYEVRLNPEQFQSFLDGIAPQLTVEPQPARFTFNDETRQLDLLAPSVSGRALDVPATLAAIESALFETPGTEGVRRVALAFTYTLPTVHNNATAAELGITELVSEATTYYLGSTASRQGNIQEAASRFNGVVIGPGEEFSFNQWLGDVSLETGFEESLIIFAGRTIRGVGGGVCQVSTTAFQAAFYGGFPIQERYPHGYRVGYYEYGEGVGMDATVYSPVVDFRFLNDTPYHLLIETSTNRDAATVTFRYYSTSVGRTVIKLGPRISNVVAHGPTIYEENGDLRPGQTRQVEWAVDGADVTVTRQVWRNGELESEDHFFSHYLPWQSVIQVAPGELPGSAPPPDNSDAAATAG